MLDFGKELKAAREAKGLTIANIAEKTHIMSAVLEDLENENFSRIVAPIYGRGFVKLYCETVGLDPKPFIAEFMDIYNGHRDPTIRERAVVPPPLPEESPIPVPPSALADGADQQIAEPEPALAPEPVPPPQPSLFDPPSGWSTSVPEPPISPEPTAVPEPIAVPEPPAASTAESPSLPLPEPVPEPESKPRLTEPPRFTRYSAPLSDRFAEVTELGPTILRWAILVIAALVILWGVVAGVRALYRATTTPSEASPSPSSEASGSRETSGSREASQPGESTTTGEPRPPRTPIAVPPLYID